jgi:hypothetical protein
MHAARPTHLILLDLVMLIFGEEKNCGALPIMQLSQPLVYSSLLDQNILLSILSSYALNLCSSLNVKDKASHPYETRGKNVGLFILIFTFLIANGKTKYSELHSSKYSPN